MRVARLARSPFTAVSGGTALGQLSLLAALPLIARLYEPSDIGRFGVAVAIAQVTAILFTLRVQQVLPRVGLGARWAIARGLLLIAWTLTLPAGAAVTSVWLEFDPVLSVLMMALIGTTIAFNVLNFVAYAEQDFAVVTKMRVFNGLLTALGQVTAGMIFPGLASLVAAYALGSAFAALFATRTLLHVRDRSAGMSFRAVAHHERLGKFASTVGPSALLSNLGLAVPIIGVTALYGDASAGSFFLARRMLIIPTQLVASTISDVGYSLLARLSPGEIKGYLHKWVRRVSLISLLVLAGGLIAGPIAAAVVGDQYPQITLVVWIMTWPAAAQILGTSTANVLLALRLEVTRLAMNAAKVGALLGAYWVAWAWQLDLLAGLVVLSSVLVAWYLGMLAVTLWGVRRREREPH